MQPIIGIISDIDNDLVTTVPNADNKAIEQAAECLPINTHIMSTNGE